MKNFDRYTVFEQAKQWVYEAGEIIRASIDKKLTVDTKSNPNDLVTEMDKKIEKYFADEIRSTYPTHRILAEEGYGDELKGLEGIVWIIDPIDGTMNFVHQKRNFAISVAIYQEGIGEIGLIYDVMANVLYHAIRGEGAFKDAVRLQPLTQDLKLSESILLINSIWCAENSKVNEKKIQELTSLVRGTRAYGSAALEFASVAEGIIDGYLSMQLQPWDFAAGVILVNEVGGVTLHASGRPLNLLGSNPIFTGNQQIKDEIIEKYIELK